MLDKRKVTQGVVSGNVKSTCHETTVVTSNAASRSTYW